MSRYLFIDGASLQETLSYYKAELYAEVPVQISYRSLSSQYSKIFYCDCLPARLPDDSDSSYISRCAPQQELFDHLHTLDGWHVSQGIAKRGSRKRPAQQKEVDILIAVDMLSNTFRKSLTALAFISSDLDFRPLLEEVGRWGVHTTLLYQVGHASEELVHAADARRPITAAVHHSWLTAEWRERIPLPSRLWAPRPPSASALETLEGGPRGELYRLGDNYAAVYEDPKRPPPMRFTQWTHPDREFLLKYLKLSPWV